MTYHVDLKYLGKATGCFVDQDKVTSKEDERVTAYYLWLPYLLALCFILTRYESDGDVYNKSTFALNWI